METVVEPLFADTHIPPVQSALQQLFGRCYPKISIGYAHIFVNPLKLFEVELRTLFQKPKTARALAQSDSCFAITISKSPLAKPFYKTGP